MTDCANVAGSRANFGDFHGAFGNHWTRSGKLVVKWRAVDGDILESMTNENLEAWPINTGMLDENIFTSVQGAEGATPRWLIAIHHLNQFPIHHLHQFHQDKSSHQLQHLHQSPPDNYSFWACYYSNMKMMMLLCWVLCSMKGESGGGEDAFG